MSATIVREEGRQQAAQGGRIRATSITLTREDGAGSSVAFEGDEAAELWRKADDQLRAWAPEGSPEGDCEVIKFVVVFADGERYEGDFYNFHPQHPAERGFTLCSHVRDFCASFGGLQIYEGGSEMIYDQHCALAPASTSERAAFLARYELGDEAEPTIWTAPDGEGGRFYYTLNGTRLVQEWFQGEFFYGRDGWRCRVVASLPADARETRDVPEDVRKAVRKIYPQLGAV